MVWAMTMEGGGIGWGIVIYKLDEGAVNQRTFISASQHKQHKQ